jgi:hypothetical protein
MIGTFTHVIEVLGRINATGEVDGEDADEILKAALEINLRYLKKSVQQPACAEGAAAEGENRQHTEGSGSKGESINRAYCYRFLR